MDFAMIFDKRFEAEGLICIESILKHSANAIIYVLCLEQSVVPTIKKIPRAVAFTLPEIELRFPKIFYTRKQRPWAPYILSLKPFYMEYIFEKTNCEVVSYVDSDMWFWGPCEEVERALGNCSFMVTPYNGDVRPPPIRFNGGFVTFTNDKNSLEFLRWWQERCVEWCSWEVTPEGLASDEGYLAILYDEPQRFPGYRICRHPGINAASWNIHKHKLTRTEAGIIIDGKYPLVCFHYKGFVRDSEEYVPCAWVSPEVSEMLFRPYHQLLPIQPKIELPPGN